MTDDELIKAGLELAEACGFTVHANDKRPEIGFFVKPGGIWGGKPVALATSVDAIVRDVFPVLDARFGAGMWYLETSTDSARTFVTLGVRKRLPRNAAPTREFYGEGESLPYALNRALVAALTEVAK